MIKILTLKDFDYQLPKALIAAYPAPKRSDARLMVLDRKTRNKEHRIFKNLTDYLQAGDLLVLNNTKVLPARLYGIRPTGGRVEALLLKRVDETAWEMLVKPSGRIKKGTRIVFGENGTRLEGEILDEPNGESGIRKIRFDCKDLNEKLNQVGRMPLPPYLDRPDEEKDREFYQTVFAKKEGAVASPTAGLHFDEELLDLLRSRGVEICFVTLHVSYGTFQPVQEEDFSKHPMYEEEFEVAGEAAGQIRCALDQNRRIIACGTTVVRVLETLGRDIKSSQGKTKIFIYPPYEFKVVNAIITNFHLPKTTLLMLVSAFADRDFIFQAYEEAIQNQYRFFSYGDAMLIL